MLAATALHDGEHRLKVKPELSRQRARRYVMRATEGGQEVIQHIIVGDIDGGELKTPLVAVAVENVVVTHGDIEEISRCDTRWIVIVVLGSIRWNVHETGSDWRVARRGQRSGRSRADAVASETGLGLLIGAERVSEDVLQKDSWLPVNCGRLRAVVGSSDPIARCIPGHETAVVAPIEAEPWAARPGLVLQVGRLVELFVVVDAEHSTGGQGSGPSTADLRCKEARCHAGENHERREAVEVGHAHAPRVSGDL